jgi:hypothetical protein
LYRRFDGDGLLFNVNYLTTIFHPAMAQTVERIFATCVGEDTARHFAAAAG